LTNASNRPAQPGSTGSGERTSSRPSASPTGTPRAGRRSTQRKRPGANESFLERFRTPIVAIVVIALVGVVGAVVVTSASAASYECSTIDTVRPPIGNDIGQIQKDLGSTHVGVNERVTYPVCPPASGKHVNRAGFGPLEPRVYGPDDRSEPQGWIHNLEHGALVLLYSCDQGACDDAALEELRQFSVNFPDSAVCRISAGTVGPVVARFEQMPTRYAALLWGRALYMDTLDAQLAYDFFLRHGEVVADSGSWLAPPEPQCPAPSPSASPTASPSPSPSASPSAEPSPSAS